MPVEDSDVESNAWPSDDSEDDDYEASDVEADFDMDLDIEDEYIVREEDLADNIPEKTFEDYLDGSHVLDKMYKNGKFLEVFRDYCIQEGFSVSVNYADNQRHLLQDLEANLEIPIDSLQRVCMERYRIHVKLRLLYKVKSLGTEQLHGGFAQSYAVLPKYAKMIKVTNLGSYALVTWTTNGDQSFKFKACFISFAAQVKGFLGGCRPIIGIDGAHLSGYYKGIMLTTVSIDGNNEFFVLAYGIVDTESIDSWTYFFINLRCLFAHYGSEKDDWTFISDRMRTAGWSGTTFHKLFWIAANAYNEYVFGKAMCKIKEYDAAAFDYLTKVEEQWSVHMFDRAVCCDHNTTNFVESFNVITKSNRDMPALTLLEALGNWCMKKMGSRFDKAIDMEPNELTEYAKGVLETRTDESRFCHVTAAGGGKFEDRDGHVKFPITLGNMSYGCGKWQGSGIPCKHGLKVIYNQRLEPRDFVSPYFKGAAHKLTYADHIHPMADPTHWPSLDVPEIAPPHGKRSAGRPAKKRRRAPHEAKKGKRHKNNKCSLCKEVGHNALTCKAAVKKGRKCSIHFTARQQKGEEEKGW
ncbi:uncharacterized protein LOC110711581 [Chenopodium quinoa]|uniref:uncharacterized protein LOC110711581 n=1 Tax=Chenopodium quinoa TaxID=63459 RepID=UPI000B77CD90|nr:uncharacterized protein LOC110711581 [Chenopodium quinoa]